MSVFGQFLHRPRQVWFRRLNFQIHLWAGIILALYVTVIGVTGSILVFGLELESLATPRQWSGITLQQSTADIAVVISKITARYPHTHIVSLLAPTVSQPVFIAVLQTRKRITVACHPATGAVLAEVHRKSIWLDSVYDLHEDLFAHRTGRVVNGCAAAALLLLSFTGLINWWPGVRNWRRAIRVDFRRRWKRVNFDLHSAVGFWTVLFVVMWASSGIYFVWPARVLELAGRLSPIVNSRPPAVSVSVADEISGLDFHAMLQRAYALDPGTTWKGIVFPASRRSPFSVLMSRSPAIGRDYEDTLYFNPYNGQYISTWQYGVNRSLGDWFIWLQIPLHFGTHWGLLVKLLWAATGLALPLLAVTGLLMYWNRSLSKMWPRKVDPVKAVAV
jgi:uncharacterized iron-regulated membrane protein